MNVGQVQPPEPSTAVIATLKRRSDFLSIRKGARHATPEFVLEARRRGIGVSTAPVQGARFGFTVSKRVGTAVERNRIKRRLRSAVRDVVRNHARPDFDYVLIARRSALSCRFAALVSDLIKALGCVHAMPADGRRGRPPRGTMRGT